MKTACLYADSKWINTERFAERTWAIRALGTGWIFKAYLNEFKDQKLIIDTTNLSYSKCPTMAITLSSLKRR
jgi:hypothetical protein